MERMEYFCSRLPAKKKNHQNIVDALTLGRHLPLPLVTKQRSTYFTCTFSAESPKFAYEISCYPSAVIWEEECADEPAKQLL